MSVSSHPNRPCPSVPRLRLCLLLRLCPAAAALALASSARAEDAGAAPDPFVSDNPRTATVSDRPPEQRRQPQKPEPEQPPKVEEWPPAMMHRVSLESEKLSEAIFNLIEDVELASIRTGDGRVDLNAGRRVFDNHDVLGSWTVVDHLRLKAQYPFYSVGWPIFGNLAAGYGVSGSIANEFIDIRQVLPRDFARLPSIEARQAEAEQWRQPADQGGADATGADAAADEQREREAWFHPFEGLDRARYGRLWNILTFPVRIPTQADWFSHMADGEVISFTAHGTIETGPSVSWDLDVTRIVDAVHAQAFVGVYVTGEFRISIMRESGRYARVRLTRLAEGGMDANAGGHTDGVITGVNVGHWDIARKRTEITPFSYAVRDGKGRSLDRVWRYDLEQAPGRIAFERALAGRFVLSEKLAGGSEWQRQPEAAAVREIGERETVFTKEFKGSSTRYGLLYRHHHDSTLTDSDILATFGEGSTRVFRSDADNDRGWRFIWGTYQRFAYRFRLDLDTERAEQELPDAASLSVQAEISDSDTTGEEMHAYMDEVEGATGRRGFFPRPPKYRPPSSFPRYEPDDGFDRRRADRPAGEDVDYFRSSFFYQLTFSQPQIERFLATPKDRVWPLLERAFGVAEGSWADAAKRFGYDLEHLPERALNLPLYAFDIHYREGSMLEHARTIRTAWLRARAQPRMVERMRQLGAMFADRRYSAELVRLLRFALPGERVSYVIQGSSHTFGYLRDEGVGATPIDPLPEQSERRIDFDFQGPRSQSDHEAQLRELGLEPLGNGRFRLTFLLDPPDAAPRALYASLVEVRPWHFPRTVGQAAYVNRDGTVTAGRNVLILSAAGGAFADLLAKIEPGNAYVLKLAYSRDGTTWGPMYEMRFIMPQGEP